MKRLGQQWLAQFVPDRLLQYDTLQGEIGTPCISIVILHELDIRALSRLTRAGPR